MPLPQLCPKIIYGHRSNVENNVYYVTDLEIVFAAGAVLVFQDTITQVQRYLLLPDRMIDIIRLCVSPQRYYVAVLLITSNEYEIQIYESSNLKRRRKISLPPESTTHKIQSFCFTFDERYVVVVSGHPDWRMLIYNWERGKVESSTEANDLTIPTATVKQVVCSPVDTSILCMYGDGLFRMMNYQDAEWLQYGFQKADNFNITTCCFVTGDRIFCGTEDGLLLLIESADLKFIFEAEVVNYIHAKANKEEEIVGVVPSSMVLDRAKAFEEEEVKKERTVRALTTLKNGFAYSCGSVVYFFERIGPHKYKKRNEYEIIDKDYRENQTINIHNIMHLAVNPSETEMLATTRKSQLFHVKLWGPELDIAGRVSFTHLWMSLHNGPIGDLAVCLWKPIFLTCGKTDRTVRVWNYQTCNMEMMKQYQENIHSVSLHPTGGQNWALAFIHIISPTDDVNLSRFMIVLIDDLQVSRELPIRECPKSAFNLYGHLLAAVNRNLIQIYNIITFQNVANLKGHSNEITCLQWTQDDRKLISCGMDGAIYEWDMNTFKRIGEVVHKGTPYLECAVLSNGKNIFAVGADYSIKEFRASNVIKTISLPKLKMTHVLVSRSNQIMFSTTTDGILIIIKIPLDDPPEYEMFHGHALKIDLMKLSMDDRNLITCTLTGAVCVWTLENVEGLAISLPKEFQYFKEILISKTDLEEKLGNIKDLTQRIYELEMEHAYQMRHIETVYEEKIKDIEETYEEALNELKATLDVFEANYNTELNDISSDTNVMKERHEAEMMEMEAKYNAQLIVEYNTVLELESLKERLMKEYKSKLESLQTSKEKTIDELTRINESKLYNLNKMVEEAREEINKEVAEHTELMRQIEDSNDQEIQNLKAQSDKTLKAARESNMRLKGESGVLKKKIISCEKERDLIQMEIINVTADNEKFMQTIKNLEQEILDLKKEIGERDLRIQEKERRIYDLKITDQEYERYKFVMNCKIKELKNQIEPMDKEIKQRKEHVADMEIELYELQKINLALDNNLSLMREKLGLSYKSLHVHKNKYINVMQLIKKVKADIFAASAFAHDYKKVKDSVKKMYVKYITDEEFLRSRKSDLECIAELQKQKLYLQGIVKDLEKKVEVSKFIPYGEGMIYMEMNWSLMEEINKIRKKLKKVQRKSQDIETLICVRMTKNYTPRETHKIIQKALRSGDEIKEECEIKMAEATTKAALMKKEVDWLFARISEIEMKFASRVSIQKKKKRNEPLHFDIPSII